MPPPIEKYRLRLANFVIDPTALRNQGAPGVNKAVRAFLAQLDLSRFSGKDAIAFAKELDQQSELLLKQLPEGAKNWGAARKALNLFLGEAYHHRFVCRAYKLDSIKKFLEVPLDSQLTTYLQNEAQKAAVKLPRWTTIKSLTRADNKLYQDFASELAKTMGKDWVRIYLDVITWNRQ